MYLINDYLTCPFFFIYLLIRISSIDEPKTITGGEIQAATCTYILNPGEAYLHIHLLYLMTAK